jgi:hypothetical protein
MCTHNYFSIHSSKQSKEHSKPSIILVLVLCKKKIKGNNVCIVMNQSKEHSNPSIILVLVLCKKKF